MAPPDSPAYRMPGAPPPKGRTLVFTALGAVLAAALILAILSRAGTTTSRTAGGPAGAPQFDVGPADQRAPSVDRSGPLLFQDLLGGARDIYVQHLAGAEWVAVEAHAPGAPRRCVLRWDRSARQFSDPCDGRVFPADGAGLAAFATKVDARGHVVVDLSAPLPPATTTTVAGTPY